MADEAPDAEAAGDAKYHYWHDKVAKGEGAAPDPTPQLLAAEPAKPDLPEVSIMDFG
jgi:hypothetical protein